LQTDIIAIIAQETAVAQLIVRDVDDAVAQALRERAAANGRSVEAEHRMILREVLRPAEAATDFAAAAARMRARLRRGTDSESLVREGRDRG
jgi:plasmid stability protein